MTRKPITMLVALSSLLAVGAFAADASKEAAPPANAPAKVEAAPAIYPAAILPFEERGTGVKDMGGKVADILFASLAANPNLILVDRAEMDKLLQEAELNLTGIVSEAKANKVGEITGAKILITGSVFDAGGTLFLVAKVIGTETSRVLGASVQGTPKEDLAVLGEKLAAKVSATIAEKADQLVAKPVKPEDRIAAIKAKLGDAKRPVLAIKVSERHVGQATIDPAAQTELAHMAKELGFEVFDPNADSRKADLIIDGEGFSEFALRRGNLVSVKARLEIKVTDPKTDKLVASDRQTAVVVDLTEQIAGKAALQQAAALLAERIFPKIVGK